MAGVDILASACNGANAAFLTDLYAKWAEDPRAVDPSFSEFFASLNDEAGAVSTDALGASWAPRRPAFAVGQTEGLTGAPIDGRAPALGLGEAEIRAAALDSVRALMLIRAYRVRGHLEANLDPLGLSVPKPHAELDPASYGFTDADFDRPIFIANVLGRETATLREILVVLRATYCGSIGVEFMHIQDPEQKSWIQRSMEGAPWVGAFDGTAKRGILRELTEAEGFESFCQKRFVGTKRFGLEGGEAAMPALNAVIETAVASGVNEIVIGMPHRGRLNTLVNVVKKPLMAIFSEFAGASSKPDDVQGAGDVKYHLGTSTDVEIGGRQVHLSLQPNPSHLEAVDPVVIGKVRARQDMAGDSATRRKVLGVLMHGDAAFAGQGLVYETLAMSKLIGYRTGGTVHLVVNNQIGFTTVPVHAFSGLYCTDVAKSVQSPIFHVNGDDPEAVVYCARLAAEFRHKFGVDTVVDIVCYRRHGHNETDEPAFTQPQMYRAIAGHKTTRALYAERLAADGSVATAETTEMWDTYATTLEEAYEAAQSYKPNKADWLEGHWSGFGQGSEEEEEGTAVAMADLRRVGRALAEVPEDFDLNPKLRRQLDAKRAILESGEGIDWATGEALAFGTLLLEGHRVRLSGEDVERGTFSQRHAVLIDQTSQRTYMPLNAIAPGQARFEVYNSLLSEAGVLGFEYGYSLADPRSLVLWEAQFGDFANGAQVIIDQFVSAGESKWLRMSGLTLLLPHGYEGQGPEHSSARLERYLQLCAESNIQVCNPTTPANYFHALRRQVRRNFRKPLVLMTPKSLLRHKLAVSRLADMAEGSGFRPVIGEIDGVAPGNARRIVVSSGKLYYDLFSERHARKITDVALLRLEQFYPFPGKELAQALRPYAKAELVWCQEEPENMGGWSFVDRRLERVLADIGRAGDRPRYVGRGESASPATGLARAHAAEQEALIDRAFARD